MTKKFIILSIVTFLSGCSNSNTTLQKETVEEKAPVDTTQSADISETFYVKNTGNYELSSTYPFSEATSIEILSYPNRFEWDTTLDGKHSDYFHPKLIRNGKLNFNTSMIRERVKLDPQKHKELFDILFNSTCELKQMAACFEPRHSIIFYDKNSKPFAFIEMCFSCQTARVSDKITTEVEIACYDKILVLKQLFIGAGVNFGYKGDEEE